MSQPPGPHGEPATQPYLSTEAESAPAGIGARSEEDGHRYRVLRPHARGGLGEVFIAEDTELHREVALKEIRAPFADHPTYRGRFLLEAEITGRLEHPGIVPVYGLGAYSDGRPYYAMRLVRGETLQQAITRFHTADDASSTERNVAFRDLLIRFVGVCQAVAYAHSRGVLHRDLKPANVLLGPFGETLVVDWGLAKAMASTNDGPPTAPSAEPALAPSSGAPLAETQPGSAVGTPAFMSPEQAAGRIEEVGPASDVYSLGATLYVVLTGRRPFEAPTTSEVLEQVQQGRFLPPRQVRPATPAALDAICRKAMALRPVDRYASALDLAADMGRWLADEPASAYREPWAARLARWARRHRTAVTAALALLTTAVVALSAGTVLVWREQQRTEQQRQVAEANYELSRDLSFQIIDLMQSSEAEFAAVPSLQATRRDILAATARACRQYLERSPDDPDLRQRSAQVFRYAANVHRLLNEPQQAEPLYRDAVRLYEDLAEQAPDDRELYGARISDTLRDWSRLQADAGRLSEAAQTLHQAIERAERVVGERPDRADARRSLAAALQSLSTIEYVRGRYAESAQAAGRAAERFRALADGPAGERHPLDTLLLASALNVVAIAEREAGRPESALPIHAEAAQLLEALVKNRPAGVPLADAHHFLAACRLEQARTYARFPAKRKSAEANLGAVMTVWETLSKGYPRVLAYRESLADACLTRGLLRAELGRSAEARADLDRARQFLEEVTRDAPARASAWADLGRAHLGLARLARAANDRPAAAASLARAREALGKAIAQVPERARDRRTLEEAQAEPAE